MAETNSDDKETTPDLAAHAGYLIEMAGRAPSVHNTQPWRFKVSEDAIELYADVSRQLLDFTGCGSGSARWAACPRSNCSPSPPGRGWPGYGRAVRPR